MPRPMTVEDLWSCHRVGVPAVHPEGWVVVPVTTYSMETNESETRLWRVDGPGKARALTAPKVKSTAPAISPDGSKLAFVRPDEKKRGQLAVMSLGGGEAEVITDLPLGLDDPKWFPDGKRIAFVAEVYRDALTLEAAKKRRDEREESKVKAYVTENTFGRFWDHWVTEDKVHHIYVIDLETREVTDLTPGMTYLWDFDGATGSWDIAPDGKEIAFSADRSDPPHRKFNLDVFTLDVAGGKITNLTADRPGHEIKPRYSADGKWLLYGATMMPEYYADRVRLVLRDRASGKETVLTEAWDRSAAGWAFAAEGKGIRLHAEDRGCHALFGLGLAAGTPEEIHRGGTYGGFRVMPDGSLIGPWEHASHPAELHRVGVDGVRTAWTDFNGDLAKEWDFGEVREHYVDGADGDPVQYYEILPPGFDPKKTWPMLLAVHGGPHGIWSDQFHYRWNMQLFASKGYVVVAPNPHGSTSWGQEYGDCIQGGWGDKPHTDCMAIVDAMEKTGYVDKDRIATAGGSYGGYMMAWFAGHTDRFQAIINHAGCSNTMSMWASDITEDWSRAMGAEPWEDMGPTDAMNPIRFSANFKTPMLVIHGELDYRVPVTQGLEIYHLYVRKGLPARLLVFPDENHWILKPQNSRLWFGEFFAWLERWMGKPGPR